MADALGEAPMTEIARLLRARRMSPVELVDVYLARIEASRSLNAFITVTAESARRQARRAERALRADEPGSLLGVPIAIKDLFATRGVRTTAGSRILRQWVPDTDAIAMSRLYEAGAVCLGKTNMHEFAYGVSNTNPWWGPARNPRDIERIPGGSSGGSAIAVVAGLCAAALGSDTGGSIRIPAALCGCIGLKPTYGAVPLDGAVPLGWSLDHAGPLTRTVDDAAALFQVLSGQVLPQRPRLSGLRVGVMRGSIFEAVEPGVARAVARALKILRQAGLRMRSIDVPEMAWSVATQLVTLRAEASTVHARWIRERPKSYGLDVRVRLQLGALVTAADYVVAQRARQRLREAMRRVFRDVDLLAMPATPMTAPRIGERRVRWASEDEPVDGALVRLTQAFNLTGLPAVSIPCPGEPGLPVGLQLVAPWGEEARLLAAARALEG